MKQQQQQLNEKLKNHQSAPNNRSNNNLNVSVNYDNNNNNNQNNNSLQIHSESYHLTSGLNSVSNHDNNSQEYDSFIFNAPSNNDIMEVNKQLQVYQQQAKTITTKQKILNKFSALSALIFLQVFMFNVFVIFNQFYILPKLDAIPNNNSIKHVYNNNKILAYQIITFYFCVLILMISYLRASFTLPGQIPKFLVGKQLSEQELDKLIYNSYEFFVDFQNNIQTNQQQLQYNSKSRRDNYNSIEQHQDLQQLIENNENENMLKYLLILDSVEFKSQKGMAGKPRYCKLCEAYKPDRCHHCSICKKCVLKMDHHCPFINNCIGFYNYKYFMCMLLYVNVMLALCVFCSNSTIGNYIKQQSMLLDVVKDHDHFISIPDQTNLKIEIFLLIFYVMISYSFISLLFLVLFLFTLWHLQMIIRGLSTIEQREKITKLVNTSLFPFDVGYYSNWCAVFGNNPLLWFLPLSPNYDGYGVLYQSRLRNKAVLSKKLLDKVQSI